MAIIYSYTSLKRGRNKEQLQQSSDSNKSIAATGMELRPGEVSTVEGKSGKKRARKQDDNWNRKYGLNGPRKFSKRNSLRTCMYDDWGVWDKQNSKG